MSLLLYAITDPGDLHGSGLDGEPLRSVEWAGLAAVVSDQATAGSAATDERMWEYERVVERLMDRCTILPARFGTVIEDEQAVRELLHRRRDEFAHGLACVRGTVEMGVRVQWSEDGGVPVDATAEPGTAYMLGRLAMLRAAKFIAGRLEPLLRISRTGKISMLPRPGVAVLGAYLVERRRAGEFADTCDRLEAEFSTATIACTGPWPPYSFARGGDAG